MTNNKEGCCENCDEMDCRSACHTKAQEDSFDDIQILSTKLQNEQYPRSLLVRVLTSLISTERQQAYAEVREIVEEMKQPYIEGQDKYQKYARLNYNEALTDLLTKLEEKKI